MTNAASAMLTLIGSISPNLKVGSAARLARRRGVSLRLWQFLITASCWH